MKQSHDILASEYVLGMLSAEDRSRVEKRAFNDAELAERIAWWTNSFEALSRDTEALSPPDGLLERIEQQIDRGIEAGPGSSLTIRNGEGSWLEIASGVRKKHLYFDEGANAEAYLIQMDPGADFPDHDHGGTEDCLVVSGEFFIGELRLRAGDFHAAFSGSRHSRSRSETGCTLFIKAAA